MFDISKELSSELVAMEQFINVRNSDLMLRLSVDMEVVKRAKDKDFRHFLSVSISPTIRNYTTDSNLPLDQKYVASNYVMFSSILSFLEQDDDIDGEDLSLISNNVDEDNKGEVWTTHFQKKYENDDFKKYLDIANRITPVIKYAFSLYGSYKSAMGDVAINTNHMNTFKMMMGKEYIDKAYTDAKSTDLSIVSTSKGEVTSSSSSSGKAGCYIASCVYQSYNCSEVYCLRRYRDYYLKAHLFGRLFIHIYYFVSPILVKLFGKTKAFKNIFKPYLDRKVEKLIEKGYSATPYND